MQKDDLIKYLNNKEPLTEDSLLMLSELRNAYPYFQTVHLLTLKNKFILGRDDWKKEVDNVSAYVTDRRVIYELLYPIESDESADQPGETITITEDHVEQPIIEIEIKETTVPVKEELPEPKKQSLRDNISGLLTLQLEELELVNPEEAVLMPEIGIDFDKTYGSRISDPDLLVIESEEEDSEPGVDEKELIDKFIETSPRLVPRTEDKPQIDISEDSVKEHDGIFTDTLAKIYIKQGYYSRAIFTYEKLILKYPEKSDYFASQIEAIKNLTNKQ
jgi:hypothetical protein